MTRKVEELKQAGAAILLTGEIQKVLSLFGVYKMDINLKNKLAEKIIQSDDDLLLNEIKSLVGLSEGDFWNDLPDPVKQAVNNAKSELNDGKGIPHDHVIAEIKDRFF